MKRIIILLFVTACISLISACAQAPVNAYEGEPLSLDKVAVIRCFVNAIHIDSIDGNKAYSAHSASIDGDCEVLVLPGTHELELSYKSEITSVYTAYYMKTESRTGAPIKLKHNFEAGKVYRLMAFTSEGANGSFSWEPSISE